MRIAVLSDIHANLEALRAVLAAVAELGVDRTLCLGDIVGYNASPAECLSIVRSEEIDCVLGNHDAVACGLAEPDHFNERARTAVLWTRERLPDEARMFLRSLPEERLAAGLFLCHGSVHDTNRYLLSTDDAREAFRSLEGIDAGPQICFFGHTHVVMAFRREHRAAVRETAGTIRLDDGAPRLINPGSVGQPRDGDPRAAFAVYDADVRVVTFHRVEYDIHSCQDRIVRAGLPIELATRLGLGR